MTPIEPATAAYVEALALIHAASFPRAEIWGPDVIALQLGAPGSFGFVGVSGGFILARLAADEAEVLTLAVHPDARRGGLGRRLLERAMAEAGGRGAKMMFLEVAETNDPARALYAACGFAEIGRRRSYYGGRVDALVLRAPILCGSRTG